MPSTGASESQIKQLLSVSADFEPNFTSEHAVMLPHDLDTVFTKLGEGSTLEASVKLSDLCRHFELLDADSVQLESGQSLLNTPCRSLPPASPSPSAFPRQFFLLQEAVPILPMGLYTHLVTIAGSLTTDRVSKMALYESSASGGILIWKLRRFEAVEEGGQVATRVHEVIKGKSGSLLRSIVEKETRRAHQAHMEQYSTLFKTEAA